MAVPRSQRQHAVPRLDTVPLQLLPSGPVDNVISILSGLYSSVAQDTRLLFPEFKSLTNLDLSNNLLGLTYLQACERKQWSSVAMCATTDASIPQ
eukprot:2559884-Pyramimonas_sp.AAC.1